MLGCGGLLLLCGVMPGGVVFLLSGGAGSEMTPTLDLTNIIMEYIDNRTMTTTPDVTRIVQEMSATQTATPTAMTSTVTATVEFTAMAASVSETPAPQITVRSYSQPAALPTYTAYPTYTPAPVVERIITVRESGQTIIQTQIVEQPPVRQTVLAPVYVIVTATPPATPVMIPTSDGLWTMQPDWFPTGEPIFGITTTGGN
jgi:hypothetical protein